MELGGKVCVVTGGASGIGAAIITALSEKGAKVVVADLNESLGEEVAAKYDGVFKKCNVTSEKEICELVAFAEETSGPVDLFCSNAGVGFGEDGHSASASNDVWQTCWDIHVMSHVYASRAVLPAMIERGQGCLVSVASAAGLLSQIGDAAYSATKHAAVGFAESLAITHGSDGIEVCVVCPQYVATPLIGFSGEDSENRAEGTILPEDVAAAVIDGIEQKKFLILPHPEVREFMVHKASDTDRWISGMQRLREKIIKQVGSTNFRDMHKLFRS